MQGIGVLFKNGGRGPPMAAFSRKGEGKKNAHLSQTKAWTSRSAIETALFSPTDLTSTDLMFGTSYRCQCRGPSWNVHLSCAGHLLRSCYLIGSHEMSNRVSVLDCLRIAVRGCQIVPHVRPD